MARAPRLTIDVTDLRRRLGQRREVEVDLDLEPIQVVETRSSSAPVTGALVVESIERGVRVTGEIQLAWTGDCRRCLDEVEGVATGPIDEIFQVAAPDDGDIRDFDGELVDLVPVVAEAVAFSLPLAPLQVVISQAKVVPNSSQRRRLHLPAKAKVRLCLDVCEISAKVKVKKQARGKLWKCDLEVKWDTPDK